MAGTVVVGSENKAISHLEGGIVCHLFVREGSEVKRGDSLLDLCGDKVEPELARLESYFHNKMAEIERLKAEKDGCKNLQYSPELRALHRVKHVAEQLQEQRGQYDVRCAQFKNQQEILFSRIEQLGIQVEGLEAGLKARQKELRLVEQSVATLQQLYEQELANKSELVARQQEQAQLLGDIGNRSAEIASARVKISEARQEVSQLQYNRNTEIFELLAQAREEKRSTGNRIDSMRDVVNRTHIVAPQAGTIIGLTVHTIGGVVPPGANIMFLVPSGEQLVVDARVRPLDKDNIVVGQEVRATFPSFGQRNTTEIIGIVRRVSADAFDDQQTGESYYMVRVDFDPEILRATYGDEIEPGMPVDLKSLGERRSMFSAIFSPIFKTVDRAMIEQ